MNTLRSAIRAILIESTDEPKLLSTIEDVRTAFSRLIHHTLKDAAHRINREVPGEEVEVGEVLHEPTIEHRSRVINKDHINELPFAKNFRLKDFGLAVTCVDRNDPRNLKNPYRMMDVVRDILETKFSEIGMQLALHTNILDWKPLYPYSLSGQKELICSFLCYLPKGFQTKANIKKLEDWYLSHFPQHRTLLDERVDEFTQVLRDMIRQEGEHMPSVADELWVRFVKHLCYSSDPEKASLARGAWQEVDRPDWMMRAISHLPLELRKKIVVDCLTTATSALGDPQVRAILQGELTRLRETLSSGFLQSLEVDDFMDQFHAAFRLSRMSHVDDNIINVVGRIIFDVADEDDPSVPLSTHLSSLVKSGAMPDQICAIIAKRVPDPSVRT